jgi:hypothetical protein
MTYFSPLRRLSPTVGFIHHPNLDLFLDHRKSLELFRNLPKSHWIKAHLKSDPNTFSLLARSGQSAWPSLPARPPRAPLPSSTGPATFRPWPAGQPKPTPLSSPLGLPARLAQAVHGPGLVPYLRPKQGSHHRRYCTVAPLHPGRHGCPLLPVRDPFLPPLHRSSYPPSTRALMSFNGLNRHSPPLQSTPVIPPPLPLLEPLSQLL